MVLQCKNDEKSVLLHDQSDHKTKNPDKRFKQLKQISTKLSYTEMWK